MERKLSNQVDAAAPQQPRPALGSADLPNMHGAGKCSGATWIFPLLLFSCLAMHGSGSFAGEARAPTTSVSVATGPITMRTTIQANYRIGEEVKLDVTIENTSSATVPYIHLLGDRPFQISALVGGAALMYRKNEPNDGLLEAKPTLYGKFLAESEQKKRNAHFLAPGATMNRSVHLSRIIDLSLPGLYRVQAAWQENFDAAPIEPLRFDVIIQERE